MTKKPSARKAASDRDKLRGESQHPRREGGNMHASELHLEVVATVTDRCHRGASMCSSTATTSPAYCSLRKTHYQEPRRLLHGYSQTPCLSPALAISLAPDFYVNPP